MTALASMTAVTVSVNQTKSCGKWTLVIVAQDPITMPAATALLSNGLKAVFKGSSTIVCVVAKSCAGFCLRNKATAATERALCLSPVAKAAGSGNEKKIDPALSIYVLVVKATFESLAVAISKQTNSGGNYEWIDKAYEGEANTSASQSDNDMKVLDHAAEVSFLRFSYWVPKTAGTTAGIPPMLDSGITVEMKCVTGEKTLADGDPDLIDSTHADVLLGETGKTITTGGPAGSYKAAVGSIVLTRPASFAQAATPTTDYANMPVSAWIGTSVAKLACQGSWLKVYAVTPATWKTDTAADTALKDYTTGMKMMISIRLVRAVGPTGTGYANATTMALCVKLSLFNGVTADTGTGGICFYTASAGLSVRDPTTDANNNGFKTIADPYQTLNLMKPDVFVADTVVGAATTGKAAHATDNLLVSLAANATTYKMLKVTMTGPGAAADCISGWMAAGSCLVTASLYLPKAAKTASRPFLAKDGDKAEAFCVTDALFKAGAANVSEVFTGTSNANAPGNPNNAQKTVTASPAMTAGGQTHAMLAGTATCPLKVDLEVAGLVPATLATIVTAVTAAAAYTDGYQLTSRITLTANNAVAGALLGACYGCDGTTCTDTSGYCHTAAPAAADLTNMQMNKHTVSVCSKEEMAKGKATVTTGTAVVGVFPGSGTTTTTKEGALLAILAPVASTGSWTADTMPLTLGCLGCLVKPPTSAETDWETKGMLVARWYQPTQGTETTTSGPRFNKAENVTAWALSGITVVKGDPVVMKGGLSLAATLAGVAAGAAALAM